MPGGGDPRLDYQSPGPTVKRANPLARYIRWLHTQWPAGTVEKLPKVNEDGSTNVPGLYVVGDLTGIPLLKFSSDTGAKAVQRIVADPAFKKAGSAGGEVLDLVILGAGVSGMAAALEARKHQLRFEILEAAEPFSTIVNFPRGKPIYTYPTEMTPAGDLQFRADIKEALVDELRAQTLAKGIAPKMLRAERITRNRDVLEIEAVPAQNSVAAAPARIRARRVIIAIGRSGNFRMLGVPGEEKDKVYNRLHDPKEFADKNILVVGGGDSALETAVAIAEVGGHVTLSYRKPEFSRPKPDNLDRLNKLMADPMADVQIERPSSERVTTAAGDFMRQYKKAGSITLMLGSKVKEIREECVVIVDSENKTVDVPNDAVFTMLGREAPLDFFRRSGVHVNGDWRASTWISFILIVLAAIFVYHWKKGGVHIADVAPFKQIQTIGDEFSARKWFPYNVPDAWALLGGAFARKSNLLGVMKISLGEPGFYYSLAYCVAVVLFGRARIRRRKTPYVKVQTYTLMAVQVVPLFLLPYIILPWMGNNGWFDHGLLGWLADQLFPKAGYGHGREYWRSFGFVLAWPLFFWNVFTSQPLWLWLGISFIQTFVIIPLIIYKWGKGAYCGWICSCGALAETVGDTQRHKMPHGPVWNRVNLVGQAFLVFAFVLLIFRSLAWMSPGGFAGRAFDYLFHDLPFLNYAWFVDLLWAGILGVGLYWHFSGRVWCRFACPLAALMHIYARFSRFRILADKKKCISCNVCTSVCHQGIDVMNFANKGMPMEDPECVRCSACVQSCPTGVLTFGEVDRKSGKVLRTDRLQASPVQMVEVRHNGKVVSA
jgi:NosR/NirI family nitrous oxide reductase transcriptional regulator